MKRMNTLARVGLAAFVGLAAMSSWANCGSCEAGKQKPEGCKSEVCAVGCKAEKAEVAAGSKIAVINSAGLAALLKAKAPVTILDARAGKYDDGRRIPGAQQLSPNAEPEAIAKLLPNKDALIVTYCAGLSCPASKMLAERLKGLGYANVIEYPQGIAGWAEEGNAVEEKGK